MADYTRGLADGKAKLRALKEKFADPQATANALGLVAVHVTLERAYVLCPWHNEHTPSCCLSRRDSGLAVRCFGCGKGGDVLALAAAQLGVGTRGADFNRVVSYLEGLQLEVGFAPTPVSSRDLPGAVDPHPFAVLAECIADLCPVESEPEVAEYLRGRRIFGAAQQARWSALPSGHVHQSKVIDAVISTVGEKAWLGSGLAQPDSTLTFPDHRLVIPWRDPLGYAVTIQRRLVGRGEDQPKYVSAARRCFMWPYDVQSVIDAAPDAEIMLVEGAVDAVAVGLMTADETPGRVALGLPGVAGWRSEWRFLCAGRRVAIGFDADSAGMRARERVVSDLRAVASEVRSCRPGLGRKDWAELLLHSGVN